MKKLSASILIAALSLSLTACGTGAATETVLSGSGTANAAASGTTSEAAVTTYTNYTGTLFDTGYVHTIDIQISDDDWADLLANPLDKTKYEVNVTIDGNQVDDVSFATKGNTSLSSIASDDDSNKYSFKINFGKYVEDQTYEGLEKLNLNNIYADATYMKDYMSYMISNAAGVDAPMCSYIWVTVNGEDQGLYLALENVDESYLNRIDSTSTEIYKPEAASLDNAGNGGGMQQPDGEAPQMPDGADGQQMTPPDGEAPQMPDGAADGERPELPDDADDGEQMTPPDGDKNEMGGGFGSDDSGASLKYTDDDADSYSDIFDNVETEGSDESQTSVINALKGLSEYLNDTSSADLDDYIDTDEVIRYFAAHNFVLNYDSYTGNMLHNYYLLETDGKLSMVPWDYNLAFGAFSGMGGGNGSGDSSDSGATSLINTGIDSPLSGSSESDRPMWAWITSDETYLNEYHSVMNDLLENYFENGEYASEIRRVSEMIRSYVEKDTYASYTVDEFDTAVENLQLFGELRAESIRKQLDGELSTVTTEQDASSQVDASSLNITAMGTQGGDIGGGHAGNQGGPGGRNDMQAPSENADGAETPSDSDSTAA